MEDRIMTTASEIESALIDDGYDVEGIVYWDRQSVFYAVGYYADDLPQSINGASPIDDPDLIDPE